MYPYTFAADKNPITRTRRRVCLTRMKSSYPKVGVVLVTPSAPRMPNRLEKRNLAKRQPGVKWVYAAAGNSLNSLNLQLITGF
jgi:hypothetical protein